MTTINFYSPRDKYGCFSNFSRHPIMLDGKQWKTSEHYFQAQKFVGTDPAQYKAILKCAKPGEAARLGRDKSKKMRKDWDTARLGVMREALIAKFTQHEDLKGLLLSTGDAKLVEHTVNDSYWGDGGNGSGENWLGQMLMSVRDSLRRKSNKPDWEQIDVDIDEVKNKLAAI